MDLHRGGGMTGITTRFSGRVRALLVAFAVLSAAVIGSEAPGLRALGWAAKPLAMPALAALVITLARAGTALRLPVLGLLLAAAGDTALMATGLWFLIGMGLFAGMHVCFITAFTRCGAASRIRRRPILLAGYLVAWAVLLGALWPGLGALRLPLAGYSVLLFAMAALAAGMGRAGLAGGVLFVISDGLIAAGLAKVHLVPGQSWLILPAYLAAQYLIAAAWSDLPLPRWLSDRELPAGAVEQVQVRPGG